MASIDRLAFRVHGILGILGHFFTARQVAAALCACEKDVNTVLITMQTAGKVFQLGSGAFIKSRPGSGSYCGDAIEVIR